MKIGILAINYWPEKTGIAVYNVKRCEYLARRGHDVTVWTTFPYYPEWRVADNYAHRIVSTEQRNGVTIRRTRIYVPARVQPFKRLLHEASFTAFCVASSACDRRPDVIVAVSTPLGTGLAAILLSALWKVPFVFHVEDLQPDAAVELGMLRSGSLIRLLFWLERLIYRKAALVSAITRPMADRIVSKGVSGEKVAVFAHGIEDELFDVPIAADGATFRRAFGLEAKFLVTHCGNMGVKQGLDVVLESADKAREIEDLRFVLVGDGAARISLEESTRSRRLTNVVFLPLQSRDMFLELLAASDISLITQQRTVADVVFPSKTETLLASGRTVVGSVNSTSEVARVLLESGAEVVEPENADALLDAVLRLKADPERRRAMGEAGRNYAKSRWAGTAMLAHMERCLADVAFRRQPRVAGLPEIGQAARHEQSFEPET